MLLNRGIRFPNLGITFGDVPKNITVFGVTITIYGIIIAVALIVGVLIIQWQVKRTGQNKELYLDFALYAIILAVIGARLFYVAFKPGDFTGDPMQILNIRTGGLAIYGAILTGLLTAFLYAKIRKISFGELADTCVGGVVAGQIVGRIGSFFSREFFGAYTDNLFAMQLNIRDVSSDFYGAYKDLVVKYAGNPNLLQQIGDIRDHRQVVEGITYIQVQPVFLYEMIWNLGLLLLILLITKHRTFKGELLLLYLGGYGLGRFWMESICIDRLYIWGTTISVAQVISLMLVVGSVILWFGMRIRFERRE